MPTQTAPNGGALPSTPTSHFSTSDNSKIRVVLVNDDDGFRELAAGELEFLGFEVETYHSGEALLEARATRPGADVIVLDWKVKTELGLNLLRELRKRGASEPVVYFTGLSTITYETAALDCGAVDFIDKSRGTSVLAKRLRRIVEWKQHLENPARRSLQVGMLSLSSEVVEALWGSKNVGLTLTEFNVVYLLASRAGEYISYRSIYDRVHHEGFAAGDGEYGYRTNVRSLIKRIRNKFRACCNDFSEIENFAALGYRWRTQSDSCTTALSASLARLQAPSKGGA